MNFNSIKQELNKKIKKMSQKDFENFITELKRIYYKARPWENMEKWLQEEEEDK